MASPVQATGRWQVQDIHTINYIHMYAGTGPLVNCEFIRAQVQGCRASSTRAHGCLKVWQAHCIFTCSVATMLHMNRCWARSHHFVLSRCRCHMKTPSHSPNPLARSMGNPLLPHHIMLQRSHSCCHPGHKMMQLKDGHLCQQHLAKNPTTQASLLPAPAATEICSIVPPNY